MNMQGALKQFVASKVQEPVTTPVFTESAFVEAARTGRTAIDIERERALKIQDEKRAANMVKTKLLIQVQ